MSVAIGIDLGTTNTAVAAVVDGVAVTLEDEGGRRLLPSVVSFHPSGTVLVGDAARERRLIDPENTVYSVKPLIGRSFDSDEVKAAKGRFPFHLVEGAKKSTMVHARGVDYALPEISAFVLRRAKAIAEAALKTTVDRAVITVPANFNDLQRASTKIAGKLAGLDVMRILNEPTAAALAYGQSIAKAEKIAVYDLGGGTFDVTLLDLTGNVFEVLATAGDTALGGDDLDRIFAERIALDVVKRFNLDPRTNPVAFSRLRFFAEEIKKELSTKEEITREISGIGFGADGMPVILSFTFSRAELERLVLPLIERTIGVVRQSVEIIGLSPTSFDRVILVGGSTRMPLVARMVENVFGQAPHLKVNPDEVVALGAAIQAHALNRSKAKKNTRPMSTPQAFAPGNAPAIRQRRDVRLEAPAQPAQASPPATPAAPPRPPPVPTRTSPSAPRVPVPVPAAPASPSEDFPQFIAFSKASAVITFSPPPVAPSDSDVPPPFLVPPAATMPFEAETPLAPAVSPASSPPPVASAAAAGREGRSDHAATRASRPASLFPIEGAPLREASSAAPAPKPPRTSTAPEPAVRSESKGTFVDTPDRAIVPAPPSSGELAAFAPMPLPASSPAGPVAHPGATEIELDPDDVQIELDRAPNMADFARGSAVATKADSPLLIDVTPLTLRVETVGGYSDAVIEANSPVPCEKTRAFLTASDRQTTVTVRVAQGESAKFAENTFLGELELRELRAARRGEVKIAVTFELDADGILKVRAKDAETGRETLAEMRLLGTASDDAELAVMQARQARHEVR
jgi:molecular chaperone DnaK